MNTKYIQEQFRSKKVRTLIFVIGFVVIALVIFSAGLEVGYMKATFGNRFGDSYYHPFDPNGARRDTGIISSDVSNDHGVTGKIVSITLPTIIVADNDNTEKVVSIDSDTIIRSLRNQIAGTDLKPGDAVVVIGEPDEKDEVEAKFIRVLPQPAAQAAPAPAAPAAVSNQ